MKSLHLYICFINKYQVVKNRKNKKHVFCQAFERQADALKHILME